MFPSTFSSQEAYAKHRYPDEIREMERQTQVLRARAYRYGDPVNRNEHEQVKAPRVQTEKRQTNKMQNALAMLRTFLFVFSVFIFLF
jgi:hypothetical protein